MNHSERSALRSETKWLGAVKWLAIALPAALSLGCTVDVAPEGEDVEQVQEAVQSTPRELHVVAVTNNGGLRHALRSNTTWTSFGNVESAAGEIGTISDAEAVSSIGGLHVVAVSGGQLFHTIRAGNGGWLGFGNVNSVVGNVGTHTSVGLAHGEGRTHLCTTTSSGGLYHTMRNANGSWSSWINVKTATGTNPGSFTRVDCSARLYDTFSGGFFSFHDELHLVATTSNGTMWHAVRHDNGTWTALGNVNVVTGTSAIFTDADASISNGSDLQIVGTGTNFQRHGIRFLNGSWSAFGNPAPFTGDPGDERYSSTVSLDDGLHVLVSTANGGLFNTRRSHTDGSWLPYANVKTATGSTETFSRVSVAGLSPVTIPQ